MTTESERLAMLLSRNLKRAKASAGYSGVAESIDRLLRVLSGRGRSDD